jgi:cytochrome c
MIRSHLVSRRVTLKVSAGVAALLLAASSPAFAQQSPPDSDKAKQIMALVEKAAALIDSKGKSVFPEFRRVGSEWLSGDIYLFASEVKGAKVTSVFNGAIPQQEGTDVSGLKDSNGKLIVAEMLKVTQSKGAGWVDYMFPKPGQSQSSQKWSYVKAVTIDGTPGLVGAGFYP